MLSTKRFLQILTVLLLLVAAFWGFNASGTIIGFPNQNPYVASTPALIEQPLEEGNTFSCLVLGSSPRDGEEDADKTEQAIFEQVQADLSQMRLAFTTSSMLTEETLRENPVVVVTSADPGKVADLALLGEYIRTGGKVLFAAGIPEGFTASYLNPVWDIAEKGNRFVLTGLTISDGFLPYEGVTISYNAFAAATRIALSGRYEVFVRTNDGVPLVYGGGYQQGRVMVINATILEDPSAQGFFYAALGELTQDLLYPVLGVKTVCLDGFPPLGNAHDETCFWLYGRSAESFTRDVLWPALLRNSSRQELKYTVNLLAVTPDSYATLASLERQNSYYAKQILSSGGELGLAGNHWGDKPLDLGQAGEIVSLLQKDFPNYRFSAYSILSGSPRQPELTSLFSTIGTPGILRYQIDDAGIGQRDNRLSFSKVGNYVTFPCLTTGFTKEQQLEILSGLTAYGTVSHGFALEELLGAPTKETGWDQVQEGYQQLNRDYFEKTPWLRSTVLSENEAIVKGYAGLSMSVRQSETGFSVRCSGFLQGQAFYLRTNRDAKAGAGCTLEKINDRYFLVTAQKPDFSIEWE